MKALFMEDDFFTRKNVETIEGKKILAEVPQLEYDFAKDTNSSKFKNMTEFTEKLEKQGPEGWVYVDEEVKRKLPGTEVLFVHASGVTEELMDLAPDLKLIFLLRSGTENVNVEAAHRKNITVCNCPSRLAEPVADMCVAMMICECRGICRGNLQATHGEWIHLDKVDRANSAFCNLTIGLYGYGGIARVVAKRLTKGFGSRVIALDPFVNESAMLEDGVEPVSREELLTQSDILSLHVRLIPETVDLIGEAEFGMMKPTAVFVNTSRAPIVNEKALIDALTEKKIRGAALDVFWKEPLPKDHPLLALDNVTLTPHRAGITSDVVVNTLRIMVEELKRYACGEALKFTVK